MPVPLDVAFWEEERQLLFNILFPQILKYALLGAKSALSDIGKYAEIGVDWGLVNHRAYEWAHAYTYELVTGINATTEKYLQGAVSSWIQSGAPLGTLSDTIEGMFGEVRAKMIAVTEVTRAFAQGNIATWMESGVVSGQRWMTAEDDLVCDICGEEGLRGKEDVLGGDFGGAGLPPAHVNCRCWMQPIVGVTGG